MTAISDAQRKNLIKQRQLNSKWWWMVHRLGSLQLAMILLSILAIACASATIMESQFNGKIARAYFYRNPLFIIWLTVLATNLFFAALTRWPWQKKHTGFVITHAGIITLLFGAMIGSRTGFEANITLEKGIPNSRLILDESVIQFNVPRLKAGFITDLNTDIRVPTEEKPRKFNVPETELTFLVTSLSTNAIYKPTLQVDTSTNAAPGFELEFQSAMMGKQQSVVVWNGTPESRTTDFFGMASVQWVDALEVTEKDRSVPHLNGEPFAETRMILMKAPELEFVDNTLKLKSPYGISLNVQPDKSFAVHIDFDHADENHEGHDHSNSVYPDWEEEGISILIKGKIGKPMRLPDGTLFEVINFWPHFIMKSGKPDTMSQKPENPAVLIKLSGRMKVGPQMAMKLARPVLKLAPFGKDEVAYEVSRNSVVSRKGIAKVGQSFQPGWADWSITIKAVHDKSILKTDIVLGGPQDEGGVAIMGYLTDSKGARSQPEWIMSGSYSDIILGPELVQVGYGLRTMQVPFTVALEKFEVPRDEGTDKPANFISHLLFSDIKSGEQLRGHAEMNHPASFPKAFWRSLTGQTYKFSQAEWDPENLDTTTLQVLHDPGWLFKWIGSLMICAGIFTMFYIRPGIKKKEETVGTEGKAI
ncbi:MAG: hypothetical protein SGI71_07915 [Verrucomicrobiota bacterium]|nr:hypothetical protein [Verrucomicrobiota bacterium]